jgi:dTDP-4-dehydrorhamnose reductase
MRSNTVIADSICVVGAAGQLGHELVRPQPVCGTEPSLVVQGLDLPEMDITRTESVQRTLERLRPRTVINAAAYTDVDGCESNSQAAYAVNATGPANLAEACRQIGAKLVHVSTDYVFDGRKRTPYEPEDAVNPQSIYGKSKAEGEQRVREILADHVIVRTSWLFGLHGKSFVKTILRLAAEKPELRVVVDQVGCPTYAVDLATAILVLGMSSRRGTYHFCGAGACSWFEFAVEIVRVAGMRTPVRPMTTAELSQAAPRPAYSILDTSVTTDHTGLVPRPWQEALAECLDQLHPRHSEP